MRLRAHRRADSVRGPRRTAGEPHLRDARARARDRGAPGAALRTGADVQRRARCATRSPPPTTSRRRTGMITEWSPYAPGSAYSSCLTTPRAPGPRLGRRRRGRRARVRRRDAAQARRGPDRPPEPDPPAAGAGAGPDRGGLSRASRGAACAASRAWRTVRARRSCVIVCDGVPGARRAGAGRRTSAGTPLLTSRRAQPARDQRAAPLHAAGAGRGRPRCTA